MRVLYLMPAPVSKGPMGPGELARRKDLLRRRVSSEFEWEVGETDEGPTTIESLDDEQLCIPGTVRAARTAEREGFSAVVIGCFADPGLELVRCEVTIPVIGPAEASLDVACRLGKRYGILTVSDAVVPLMYKVVKTAGLEGRMAGIRTIDTTVLHVNSNREAMLDRLITAGKLALSRDGADVLVLGCMSLAFLDVAGEVSDRLRAPVVCPLTAAIERAAVVLRVERGDSQDPLLDRKGTVPVIA